MKINYIKKRDDRKVPFEKEKIETAILKAMKAVDRDNKQIAQEVTEEVLSYLKIIAKSNSIPTVEQIQDLVEKSLIEKGEAEIAKSYILYREQHARLRHTEELFSDAINAIDSYLDRSDWKVNENSNMGYSLQGLNNHISSEVTAQYWLQEIYPQEIRTEHKSGSLHIHDLGNLAVYCCGWNLKDLLLNGFGGVSTKVESNPPKHFRTALLQTVNFFYTLQGEAAGAQALSNFDTYLAPFIHYDDLSYEEVKQGMQEFIYNLNVPTRVGFQTPFTNITMDLNVPQMMKDEPVIIGGEYQDETYGEFEVELDMFNKAFAEVMLEGDKKGRVFSFPIPTYNITDDFNWDNEVLEPVWEMTAKYGIPYFCLDEDTNIITNNGIKKVKDLNIDTDKVLGEDNKFYEVTNYFKNEHSEYIKIETKNNNTIKSSKNHKFPTNNGLKKAIDLSLNDKLYEHKTELVFENGFKLSYKNQSYFDIYDKNDNKITFENINKENIQEFYYLKPTVREMKSLSDFNYPKNRYQTTLKEIDIPKELDTDIFEIIGELLGDGYLPKNKNSIRLTSNDDEIINFFSETIKYKFGLDTKICQAGNSDTCLEANVNSAMLKSYLQHLGLKFGIGSEKEIPSIVYHRSDAEISALLRGLFDTDGSITINNNGNPNISLVLKNHKLLQQVLELLMFLGIVASYKDTDDKYGKINIHGSKNINLFKEKIGFRINRKNNRLQKNKKKQTVLGDKIITKEQSFEMFGNDHRQYYDKEMFRIKENGNGIYLFTAEFNKYKNKVDISNLKLINNTLKSVDITVNSNSHLFTLSNGIITHNSNMVNSDVNPEDVRSMCCRLRLSNKELRKRGGALFGSNPMTGSIGVVTINMPRIGYLAEDKEEFIKRVYELMDIAQESLEIKRKVLERLTDNGLYPYSKFYLRGIKERFDEYWKNHFNTIGLNGMNEALLNFMGQDIASEEGRQFAIEVMEAMRERLVDYQEETGNIYNLEATPAEGTSYRFANLDKQKFGADIICANQERVRNEDADPYYTNSTQLPVGHTTDIFEAFQLQDPLQKRYNGGCIEKGNKVLTDKGSMKIENIVNNYEDLKPIKALSYNPDKKEAEWDLITDAMSIDVTHNDKIRVKGEKGLDITTSDWHPFFVLEKIPVDKKCPICDKEVAGVRGFAGHMKYSSKCREKYNKLNKYQVVEKRADELKEGDYILQNSDNLYPEQETNLDQDLMWLIGYFIGDGCISQFKDNRGGNNLTKYKLRLFDANKQNLVKAKKIINENFNADINVIQNDKRSNKLYHLITSKQDVIDFFFNYGFSAGEKTYDVKITSEVKSELNAQNIYSLLSGLLDSDGHINKRYGNGEYYTVSENLANDLVEICSQAGIMVAQEDKPTNRENEVDGFRITIPAYQMTMLKDKLTIVNDKKYIKDDLSNRKLRQLPVVRVTATTKVDIEDNQFYDLTTKNNHNYLAGNNTMVFIHNTVLHGFLGERMPSVASTKKLVKRLADNFELPYYSITPTFSICPKHGYLAGEHEYCPKCDAEIGYQEE
ncbi:oxygen-sensitive ribonucleoside-triphosphate reductase [Halobacteroides halobius DSM 5150]|uniref:Oxygen-sensitive ribonucleoside-triphosphate reductase n=1 Tax=Halobacteroides halobius (strain ATCC 35273 / DSM 5150 / MD-1) TaxID=748449 RepID=L0KCI0_HALHC|nr:anaerobic ribonucleoside-triphosphate reductase [Halobacteroides halobius]AGB42084.1 oxygen-sensitive ribonucleoside-triphosphate reductase [Halobacteroides halobius DSM 5150]